MLLLDCLAISFVVCLLCSRIGWLAALLVVAWCTWYLFCACCGSEILVFEFVRAAQFAWAEFESIRGTEF
jgi:hypothetical protein